MTERVLITGAGGFLGSHMCEYFSTRGHEVSALGRFSSQFSSLSRQLPNLWRYYGMTLPDKRLADAMREFSPTLIVHCAGTASVAHSVNDPYGDFQGTVEVCAFTLEMARLYSPKARFFLCSSASVYGNPTHLPIREDSPRNPISPYGYHKVLCELLVEEYEKLHGLSAVILRIFSAYGERLQKQVVHDIFQKALHAPSANIELFGTGEESRDFIHGEDVAAAIDHIHQAKGVGVFNIASGEETKISQLAEHMLQLLGKNQTAKFSGEQRSGDPIHWRANIDKLLATGFRPSIPLMTGLQRYIHWGMEHSDRQEKR